ncbi:MAG TPA: carbamoyl-phosphate synthase large subunit [Candidatus Kapabacteria bacterium]|nr:carbamoyl-phosphate synthase large subunit [Candidatus Kapabacteria bacterium]
MAKRTDINRILVIGAGPIVIGQAGEFDYSGSQAVKALKSLGYYVVVLNSNPATIMTDPELSDKVYIEPINSDIIEQIIKKEKIEAILPTVGGQTALNAALDLAEKGIIEKYHIELLGVNVKSIETAEKRELFRIAMNEIGIQSPYGKTVTNLKDALDFVKEIGFPAIIRPSLTLGGSGGGIAHNLEEFNQIVINGFNLSPINEILVEESLLGWKEFEFEVIRDLNDNAIVVCSIENFDPMGVHTGDSITVAPAITLNDVEVQKLRDYSLQVIRKVGVATGGSNIQFAVNPNNGEIRIIEMNPRVSRSSALVSKATGFPIAKIAAQLAVGLTLDEIQNDITLTTPASFEPVIDYVVVKIPRFDFVKFKVKNELNTQMKSVGEVMSIGTNFREALQKACRSLEIDADGLNLPAIKNMSIEEIMEYLQFPNPERVFLIKAAIERGVELAKLFDITKIDLWFLENIKQIVDIENELIKNKSDITPSLLEKSKKSGFSDSQISTLTNLEEAEIKEMRIEYGINPTYKKVDTCAGEFEAQTPYYYSTYQKEHESFANARTKYIVLGGGPFRIGQGLEFDYCASQASLELKKMNIETIMINCNPETVSTDYDTSDKLYFEPVFFEDVMNIIDLENPDGIILQLGGQTPLKLSKQLSENGVKILGTSKEIIDLCEDRGKLIDYLKHTNIKYPIGDIAYNLEQAEAIADSIKYPVIVRPSYVLGGRGMAVVYNKSELKGYIEQAINVEKEQAILIDKFLENAIEVDVDAVSDGEQVIIGGIMEHIEEAGVHSGDSCSVLPPFSLSARIKDEIRELTYQITLSLGIVGFINIQYAIYNDDVYLIEVNPRASRTVPFISKASCIPLTKLSVYAMLGHKFKDLNLPKFTSQNYYAVKTPVFSFKKFPGVDTVLGPEMLSTGEVMGLSEYFGEAYVKSQIAAGNRLPIAGNVFISVNDYDKKLVVPIAKKLINLGFNIYATLGTYSYLHVEGVHCNLLQKIDVGHPNIVEMINSGNIQLVINTPLGRKAYQDDVLIRSAALNNNILCITNISAANAATDGMDWLKKHKIDLFGSISKSAF